VDAKTKEPRSSTKASSRPGPALDPEIANLMRMVADIQRANTRQLRSLWREKKLSERGLFILELVNAGLDRPSRLIEYFDVLPSTITFETDKLAAAGLLVRQADPTDRRVVRLSLTNAGQSVHRETTMAINDLLRPRLAALPAEELAQFLATFQKIVDPLRAAAGPPASTDADEA
jgi:DNA-binding MarR family transcriptional regulator